VTRYLAAFGTRDTLQFRTTFRPIGVHVMKLSSCFVAPSALAALSIVLLCGPAASQIPTEPKSLPSVTVEAPKHAAKPIHLKRAESSSLSRRRSLSAETASSAVRMPSAAPESTLGRIQKLEKVASNCNGGCESSLPHGNAPWVGCSESGGEHSASPFSVTCRDSLTYNSYSNCLETKALLGERSSRAWWLCSSLSAGGKFRVAELKRSRHTH
jgi:hypothetical protein